MVISPVFQTGEDRIETGTGYVKEISVKPYTSFNYLHDRIEYSIYIQDGDLKYRLDGVLNNTDLKEAWESGTEVLVAFSKYVEEFKLNRP